MVRCFGFILIDDTIHYRAGRKLTETLPTKRNSSLVGVCSPDAVKDLLICGNIVSLLAAEIERGIVVLACGGEMLRPLGACF